MRRQRKEIIKKMYVSHAADGTWLIRVTDGNEESDAWLLWQEP